MPLDRLYKLLGESTVQLRKGPAVTQEKHDGGLEVVHVYDMPPIEAARPDLALVDVHFMVIGVDKAKAEEHKAELLDFLNNEYPEPERLEGGPSYIEVGANIGDQGAAMSLFALGQVLGLWQVITPATLHITGPDADRLAGSGMVMMSGYRKEQA